MIVGSYTHTYGTTCDTTSKHYGEPCALNEYSYSDLVLSTDFIDVDSCAL
jgi:hypothetical protein